MAALVAAIHVFASVQAFSTLILRRSMKGNATEDVAPRNKSWDDEECFIDLRQTIGKA